MRTSVRAIGRFCLIFFVFGLFSASAVNTLVWRADANRVDADIQGWDLQTLLKHVSSAANWEIYVEPDTQHTVSAKFKDLPSPEALSRLLSKLSYALLPQTNAPPKFFVFRTTIGEATQFIGADEHKPSPDKSSIPEKVRIPNELIVSLKPGSNIDIDELARQLGGKVIGRAPGLNAYRLLFPDEASAEAARKLLSENNAIAKVDSNYYMQRPPGSQSLPISSNSSFPLRPSSDPNKIIVALIDSSVQSPGADMAQFLLPGISVVDDANRNNELTHGTAMYETLLQGVALSNPDATTSKVRVLPLDVYGNRTATTTFDVANAINIATSKGASIINLSLGGYGDSEFVRAVVQNAARQGILFFAAAGNEPTTLPTYPASYPEVIGVTAGTRNGDLAPYANRGPSAKVLGPGSSTVSFGSDRYVVNGTSVSSAYISGLAGQLMESGKSPLEVQAIIFGKLGLRR